MQNWSNYTEVMYANAFERVWRTDQIIIILIIVNYVRHRQILCHLLSAQWRSIWMEPKRLQLYEIWFSLGQPFLEFLPMVDKMWSIPLDAKIEHWPNSLSRWKWPSFYRSQRNHGPTEAMYWIWAKQSKIGELTQFNWVSVISGETSRNTDAKFYFWKYLAEQISIFH